MTAASPLALAAHSLIDERYEIIELVGSGGMGWVFRASDRALDGEPVALKFLYPHLVSNEDSFARFRNEVLVARKLVHPNIVRTYNIGISADHVYLAMEFVDGMTLRSRLKSRFPQGMPAATLLPLLMQICAALQHSHVLGIIHRDVKPDNVLLTGDGVAKMSDFGLAASLRRETQLTRIGQILGTPYYMAPEQFLGHAPDVRSDMYAMGIVMYELLCGTVPFDDASLFGLAGKHAEAPLPLPALGQHEALPRLWQVITRAAAKRPEERFQSAAELAAELTSLAADAGVSVGVDTLRSRAVPAISDEPPPRRRLSPRERRALLVVSAFLGVLWIRSNPWSQERIGIPMAIVERKLGYELDSVRALLNMGSDAVRGARARLWTRLVAGESPNAESARDDYGSYPIHFAAASGNVHLLDQLLDHGANVNAQNVQNQTPLIVAVDAREIPIIDRLLMHGADVNMQTTSGETAIHRATLVAGSSGSYDLLEVLLNKSNPPPNLTLRDKFGWDPVSYAVLSGDTTVVRMLLQHLPDHGRSRRQQLAEISTIRNQDEMRALLRDEP